MDRAIAEAIRQQSDDLRDELKALEEWQDTVARDTAAKQRRRQQAEQARTRGDGGAAASSLPDTSQLPIRGTVASIKEVVARHNNSNNNSAAQTSSASAAASMLHDPVQQAKERGNEYFRVGQLHDAVHAYTTGIDLDPEGSAAALLYANRAAAYLKLQQWALAEADATRCLQQQRGYAKAYYRRAMARKQLGKLKDARADLEAVLALAPQDASALAEMEQVTRQLQAQRAAEAAATTAAATAAAANGTATASKRVVIEEVDDDDDDDGDEKHTESDTATTTTTADDAQAAEAQQRACRLAEQEAALQAARTQQAAAAHARAAVQERALEATRRRSARVEVVDEDDAVAAPPPPSTAAAAAAPARATTQPTSASSKQTTTATRTPVAAAAAAAPAARASDDDDTAAVPAAVVRARPATSSLTPPRSFAELERFVTAWGGDDALRNHYLGLVDPATLRTLIGSNLTPEVLMALLTTATQSAGATAVRLLAGIAAIARVDDVALFLSADEQRLVDAALRVAEQAGATAAQLSLFRRKLRRL